MTNTSCVAAIDCHISHNSLAIMAKNLQTLEAQIERLRKQADALKAKEVAGVIERIKEAIAVYGLSSEDLFGSHRRRGRTAKAIVAGPGRKGVKRSIPIKYRDASGNTWTGRGLKPRWLTAALAEGKSLEDFAV